MGIKLTRSCLGPLVHPSLVLSNSLPKGFIASYKCDDGNEGENQRQGRVDTPPLEHNAEPVSVPSEGHLWGGNTLFSLEVIVWARSLATHVHVAPLVATVVHIAVSHHVGVVHL